MSIISITDLDTRYGKGDVNEQDVDGESRIDAMFWDDAGTLPEGFHGIGTSFTSAGMPGTVEFEDVEDAVRSLTRRASERRFEESRDAKDPKKALGAAKAHLMSTAAKYLFTLRGEELNEALRLWALTGEELPREFQKALAVRNERTVTKVVKSALREQLETIDFGSAIREGAKKVAGRKTRKPGRRKNRRHNAKRTPTASQAQKARKSTKASKSKNHGQTRAA